MPRFFDSARYNEDWYVELKGEYQKLFDYIVEMCDNAGVWKPNKFDFETKTGFKVNLDLFLKRVNGDKERVLVLENGRWFLPGFVKFQWFNKKSSFELIASHPFHKNIITSIQENKIQGLVKGLERVCQALKDKDKDSLSFSSGKRKDPKDEEVVFTIEHCANVAMNDERWVDANKASKDQLDVFNQALVKLGEYEKNPADYKRHFARWKPKQPADTWKKTITHQSSSNNEW